MNDDVRSFSAILADIVENLQQIVRAEIRLAKVEVRGEIAKASRAAMLVAIGGMSSVLALGLLLMACAYALALVTELWLATLIVAASTGVLAAVLIALGITRLRRISLPPPKTGASL